MFALTAQAGRQKESQTREGEKGMCGHVIEYHLWIGTTIYTEKLMKMKMRQWMKMDVGQDRVGQGRAAKETRIDGFIGLVLI